MDDGTVIAYDYDTGKELKRIDGFRRIVKVNTNLGITNNGELIRLDLENPNSPKIIVLS